MGRRGTSKTGGAPPVPRQTEWLPFAVCGMSCGYILVTPHAARRGNRDGLFWPGSFLYNMWSVVVDHDKVNMRSFQSVSPSQRCWELPAQLWHWGN